MDGAGTITRTLAEQIKAADDTRYTDVHVPEWDTPERLCVLRVFSMTGEDRARLMERYMGEGGRLNSKALYPELLVLTVYDPETGERPEEPHRVFSPADTDWLNTKNSSALERVAKAAMEQSGMGRDAKEQAGKDS